MTLLTDTQRKREGRQGINLTSENTVLANEKWTQKSCCENVSHKNSKTYRELFIWGVSTWMMIPINVQNIFYQILFKSLLASLAKGIIQSLPYSVLQDYAGAMETGQATSLVAIKGIFGLRLQGTLVIITRRKINHAFGPVRTRWPALYTARCTNQRLLHDSPGTCNVEVMNNL